MKHLKIRSGVLIAAMLLAACGQQSTPTSTPMDIDMSVRTEPENLAVGETTLIVTLKDSDGIPVNGAHLQVHGDMDHQGMTPVDGEVSESINGEYRLPFEWSMGGGWIVTVTAQLPDNGGEVSDTFEFFVEAISSESIINQDRDENATHHIDYQFDPDSTADGDATVTITVTDNAGHPVTDAIVEVTGDMPHDDMVPISGIGEHAGNGQYVVPMSWTMAGDWIVTVKATLPDGHQFHEVFDQVIEMP